MAILNADSFIGVAGAGAMGAGIAQVAAQAGHRVIVLDRDEDALVRGRDVVAKGAAALLKRGKIDEGEAAALQARISWTLDAGDLSPAALVIEAIIENADAKQSLYASLESVLSPNAVIATNTSSLSVTALAARIGRPRRFMGLHFFNPAPVMKLVEVVAGLDTDAALKEEALALVTSWGKVAVMVRDVPGFIVNRVARPFYGEGWRAYEEGAADAATLDFVYRDLAGFRMGPFELGDLIGHDVNYESAKSVFDAYFGKTRFHPSLLQGQLAAAGRLGRKSGRGVFDYSDCAEKPGPKFEPEAAEKPRSIFVGGEAADMRFLLEACGVAFEPLTDQGCEREAKVDDVDVSFTFGETARKMARAPGYSCVVLDWMRDPKSARAIAFAASDDRAREAARKLAAALGKKSVELADGPGLVVFRTLAQLANCAADAIRDNVAEAAAIDKAMMNGVNYPFGPMQWAREYGVVKLCDALHEIALETSDEIYRPSEALNAEAHQELINAQRKRTAD
ncbi:MAG: 3-hydroxyacyl-CoA dehydrogenase [Parvularcula sp.]|nr:3-hydroxyacyl-CoA dehydrogenase [Parvularcula sp.]